MILLDPTVVTEWIASPYALMALSVLSFSESAFFIIPPEIMLIPMALANPALGLAYGVLTTLASVAGAAFGYLIGSKGGKPILYRLFSKQKVETVRQLFHKYDTKAIFIAAFTPIPYKVFTVAAGVFELNFWRFIIASIIGRGSRYLLLSGLIVIFGDSIRYFLEHQLDKLLILGTIGVITAAGLYQFGIPWLEKKLIGKTWTEKLAGIFKRQ